MMMFNTRRENRRMYAALCHYEDQLAKKSRLVHESEGLLAQATQMNQVLEECNDALATENQRLRENADTDEDLVNEMYAEYNEMIRRQRDLEKLEEENYRLWVENTLLKAELLRYDAKRAAELSGLRTR